MVKRQLGVLPAELEARIEKVMDCKKCSFDEACIFLLQKVVSPENNFCFLGGFTFPD